MENNYSDIEKLAELREKGLLTETEFQEKKAKVLGIQNSPPLQQPTPKKKNSGCLKIIGITFLIIFGIAVLTAIFGNNEDTSIESNSKLSSASTQVETKDVKIMKLDNLVKSINGDKYTDNMDNVNLLIVAFKVHGQTYSDYESDKDADVQKKLKEFKTAVSNYQARLLPKMRKTYINQVKDLMWRSNIEVQSMGGSNKTIQLTGGALANNGNKQDMLASMRTMLDNLRFKRVNMKWYKYDDEYTYWDLDNPTDKELYR